jgi:hypothetical protein
MTTDEKWEHVTPAYEDEVEPYSTGTVEDYEDWSDDERLVYLVDEYDLAESA